MKKEKFIELATKVLSNEASLEEKKRLETFLKKEEYKNLYNWIANNLENQNNKEREEFGVDLQRGLFKLTQKIQMQEPEFEWRKNKTPLFNHHLGFFKIVAASIMFFALISTSVLYFFNTTEVNKSKIVLNEKKTQPGQKSILTLFDGTKITLNSNSTLKYPTHFGKKSREVYLEGEAYFEVVHNENKPFIVHSGNISTTVLGTKFNVSAFPNDNDIQISLISGNVSVANKISSEVSEEFNLKPAQQFVYNKKNNTESVRKFDLLKIIGWKDNTFIFDNEPLEKVLVKLERAYGVELDISGGSVSDYKIKANFKNESFWVVIEAIKYATGLNYKTISENDELKKVVFFYVES